MKLEKTETKLNNEEAATFYFFFFIIIVFNKLKNAKFLVLIQILELCAVLRVFNFFV